VTFPNDHAWPVELPMLLDGHAFADEGIAEDVPFEQGEDRSRQRWTFNPQLVTVSTRFTQAEFDRFVEWFETDLQAGSLRFDARVAAQGGVTGQEVAWWEAQWVKGDEPYRAQHVRARWLVSGELLLLDGPYATRTAPSLRARLYAHAKLFARPTVDTVLRARLYATFETRGRFIAPPLRARLEASTEITGYFGEGTQGRVTEFGEQRLTEGGDTRITESA
jgi:hypothetical protein